jgi:uncharacterized protein
MPRIKGYANQLITVLAFLVLLCVPVYGAFPKPTGYVNDFAGVLSSHYKSEITSVANGLKENQGVELAVVVVDSVAPDTTKLYAVGLFNDWGIGGPEDSGLLIVLALTEREIEVEVGYGLEGVLPDGKVGAILDDYVMEHLRSEDYGQGLLEAAKAFAAALAGESYEKSEDDNTDFPFLLILIMFITYLYFRSRLFSRRPNTFGGPRVGGPYIGGPRNTGFGGGGGGFGGFGGGRSGGGGAGRRF